MKRQMRVVVVLQSMTNHMIPRLLVRVVTGNDRNRHRGLLCLCLVVVRQELYKCFGELVVVQVVVFVVPQQ